MSNKQNDIWEENLKELGKCKTRNCQSEQLVDPKYSENQIGSRCEKCLDHIGK